MCLKLNAFLQIYLHLHLGWHQKILFYHIFIVCFLLVSISYYKIEYIVVKALK